MGEKCNGDRMLIIISSFNYLNMYIVFNLQRSQLINFHESKTPQIDYNKSVYGYLKSKKYLYDNNTFESVSQFHLIDGNNVIRFYTWISLPLFR